MVLGAAVETTALDDGDVGHDLELGVEAGAAVAAEVMTVDLARSTLGVVRERVALGDLEVPPVDDDVGGVGAAGLV